MDRALRQRLLDQLRADAARIAARFDLEYQAIEAEHPRVKSRYGVCYEDGLIKIRLHNVRTGRPLKYSSMIDTLCHELAHLRHFDHGPQFKAFFLELLGWARSEGIYRPSPRRERKLARQRLVDRAAERAAAERAPDRRNGVAVFAGADLDESSLWQRLAARSGVDASALRPPAPPRPRPRPTKRPARAAQPEQLSLSTEPLSGAARKAAKRGPTSRRRARNAPPRRSQLDLFK